MNRFPKLELEYKEKGFIVVRDFFSKNYTQSLQDECNELLLKSASGMLENVEYKLSPEGKKLIERIDPVICYSKLFLDLSSNKEFLEMILNSIGASKPLALLKDKLIFKPPFQEGYPPHQDMSWWRTLNIKKALSVIIAIDPCDQLNGAVEFLVGSNNRQLLTSINEPRYLNQKDLKRFKTKRWELITLKTGDICIFCAYTVHKSNPNNSSNWRKTLYFTYATDTAIKKDIYSAQQLLYLQRNIAKKILIMDDIY